MANIRTLKGRQGCPVRAEPYWDSLGRGRGLGYRQGASGGSWVARVYRNGKMQYGALGDLGQLPDYTAAKAAAEDWFERLAGGADPRFDVLAAIERFAAARTADLEDPATSTVWRDLQSVAKHVTGELLGTPLVELTTDSLERWRDAMPVKPATRRRVWATLCAALNNTKRLGYASNAWTNVRTIAIPAKTRSREFIPSEAEVRKLIAHCEPDFAALLKAAALTGCRYGELIALTVEQVDLDHAELHLEKSKTGARTMKLSAAAVAFFRGEVKGKLPAARVFTHAGGEPWGPSHQHRPIHAATKAAKLPKAFVFYSLRHFALSSQLAAGIPSAIVAKNAGTSELMLRQHYHKHIRDGANPFDRMVANL